MIRFLLLSILILVVARAFWRVVDGVIEGAGGRPKRKAMTKSMKLTRDPVCGTFVAPATALALPTGDRQGTALYFCSEKCRDMFVKGHR